MAPHGFEHRPNLQQPNIPPARLNSWWRLPQQSTAASFCSFSHATSPAFPPHHDRLPPPHPTPQVDSEEAGTACAGGPADASEASPEGIVLLQVVRPPFPVAVVKTAEGLGPTESQESESVVRWVDQRSVATRRNSTGGHRSTFSIPSRAVSDG